MFLALVPTWVIALQAPSMPGFAFAPPPRSALSGAGAVLTSVTTTTMSGADTLAPRTLTALAQPIALLAASSPRPPLAQARPGGAAPAPADAGQVAASGDTASRATPSPTRPLPAPAGISPMTLLRATLAAASPLLTGEAATAPANGLWVLATADCPLPTGTDLNAWAECTQPLGFNGDELAVLEKPRAGNKAQATGGLYSIARTRYRLGGLAAVSQRTLSGARGPGAMGAALAQVEVPGLTRRSYVYVAVRPEVVDAQGRFVAARAWPVPCPAPATPGVNRRGDRCFASTLQAVRDAASAEPANGGYVMRWIDPTDAGSAGDTTGARRYAPPPPAVFRAPRRLTPLEAAQPLPISDLPPELAAQQPAAPAYAPRKEDGDGASAAPAAKTIGRARKS